MEWRGGCDEAMLGYEPGCGVDDRAHLQQQVALLHLSVKSRDLHACTARAAAQLWGEPASSEELAAAHTDTCRALQRRAPASVAERTCPQLGVHVTSELGLIGSSHLLPVRGAAGIVAAEGGDG